MIEVLKTPSVGGHFENSRQRRTMEQVLQDGPALFQASSFRCIGSQLQLNPLMGRSNVGSGLRDKMVFYYLKDDIFHASVILAAT